MKTLFETTSLAQHKTTGQKPFPLTVNFKSHVYSLFKGHKSIHTHTSQSLKSLPYFQRCTTEGFNSLGKWEIYKSACSEYKRDLRSLLLAMTSFPGVLVAVSYGLSMWNENIRGVQVTCQSK